MNVCLAVDSFGFCVELSNVASQKFKLWSTPGMKGEKVLHISFQILPKLITKSFTQKWTNYTSQKPENMKANLLSQINARRETQRQKHKLTKSYKTLRIKWWMAINNLDIEISKNLEFHKNYHQEREKENTALALGMANKRACSSMAQRSIASMLRASDEGVVQQPLEPSFTRPGPLSMIICT